jgi:hypothetical protein
VVILLVKCNECGQEYELENDQNVEDYVCECGGQLAYPESLNSDGTEIEEEERTKICPQCGAINSEDAKICGSCHKILEFSVFRQKENFTQSKDTSEKEKNKNVLTGFWKKESSFSQRISIAGIFIVIVFLSVFIIVPAYTSLTYDNHLVYATNASTEAQAALAETEPLQKPIEDNIRLTKKSINYTDDVIDAYQQMYDNPPDNVTKKYAELRLKQHKEIRKWDDLTIRGYEEMKASGTITGGLTFIAMAGDEINSTKTNIGTYQNEIIELVQNNPDLRKRLVNAIGNEATERSLQAYNPENGAIPDV